ncbi:related to taurine dioxygenase [Fusarium torulosum]|uniref:Related to taurine dioxygenase n=1 Tax=Fusarium torulosum TaxID=33205 RepID=A0AAE8LZF2_9HYPO|nr:related to taurine dioxygenase [Fusarium torulosum]
MSTNSKNQYPEPMKLSGALDDYEYIDATPAIGREYPKADLVEWLNASNADELIRDLAITISQRGVVFFRAQNNLTNELQKKLVLRLGELTGRPSTSSLHIHPVLNSERDLGGEDLNISTISSKQRSRLEKRTTEDGVVVTKRNTEHWHSDIAFEPAPADYTCLRLVELPSTGGDTLWASGCDIYDSMSLKYQKFLEDLTATFSQPNFSRIAENQGFELYEKPRGSPHNIGRSMKAVHPVVRTNPVTGWKSIFPVGAHVSHINDVTAEESENLLNWFLDIVAKGHEFQVRFKWQSANDVAIWDNRSAFHCATADYDGLGDRFGVRVVGVGERPYFDEGSVSRRDVLERES